jgi:hypothetical protein
MSFKRRESETGLSSEEIDKILLDNLVMEGVIGPDDGVTYPSDKQWMMERSKTLHAAFLGALQNSGEKDVDPEDRKAARKIIKALHLGDRWPN